MLEADIGDNDEIARKIQESVGECCSTVTKVLAGATAGLRHPGDIPDKPSWNIDDANNSIKDVLTKTKVGPASEGTFFDKASLCRVVPGYEEAMLEYIAYTET